MVDAIASALREAARHRGFRLLASKKRTPGVGDYGKYGLADGKGKPVLGVGAEGLTASAGDIETFLRGGELETWKQSASQTPANRKRSQEAAKPREVDSAEETPLPIRKRPRPLRSPQPTPAPSKSRAEPRPAPPPLQIRKAKPSDAAAIAALLHNGQKMSELATRLAAFAKRGSGLLVAEQGSVIGCLAWTQSPTIHRPLSGRIATLLVAKQRRREGIGRALIEEAAAVMAKAGIASIEAMSDIDIRSAHGFFRKLDFSETSYRFVKSIAKPQ